MSNLKHIKAELYRDRDTGIYYGVAKRGGKTIKKSLRTDRRDIAGEKLKQFLDGLGKTTASAAHTTWKDVRETWEDFMTQEPGTQEDYRSRLDTIEEHWPGGGLPAKQLRDITKAHCKKWFATRHKSIGVRRLNHELLSLKWIFRQAVDDGVIAHSPCETLKPRPVPKQTPEIPSDEDFAATIKVLRLARRHDAADLAEFIAYCGCRLAEVAHIHGRDIGPELLTVRHKELWIPKNKNDRTIEINDSLADLLRRIQERRGWNFPPDVPLFPQRNSLWALATAGKAAGASLKITHRNLRRFFTRKCIEAGIDFQTIADWLGHSDGGILVASVYSSLSRPHAARMAKKFTYSAAS